jgi:hypothetical protein
MLWVPAGLAQGLRIVSKTARVTYKTRDFYAPQHERTVMWNDPYLDIDWQLDGEPIVAGKDQRETWFPRLREVPVRLYFKKDLLALTCIEIRLQSSSFSSS